MINQLGFEVYRFFGTLAIIPQIDGERLNMLVGEFERQSGMEPADGYGGLLPSGFRYGALDRYFIGDPEYPDYWIGLGGIYLLGCKDCGDVGCWPIVCSIVADDTTVTWKDFRQPHRPNRNYSAFGPFTFDRTAYEACTKQLVSDLAGMVDS